MKKHIILAALLIVILSLSSLSIAAVKATTNLAEKRSAYGTFSYAPFITDGNIKGVSAVSGDITDSPQYLTIDLGTNMYLDRVKIYWSQDALSNNFAVRTSSDAKYWEEEASGLDASFGALDRDSGTKAINVSLKRSVISSRYVQVMIPAGTKVTNAKGDYVRISEIEVYPAVNQTFRIDNIDNYASMDTSFIIKYRTSIGAASGSIAYGTAREKLDKVAVNAESGVDNSVVIGGLKPRTIYYYQITATDYYGDTINSDVKSFVTSSGNIALNKKVTGTFTNYPAYDKYVKAGSDSDILSRTTDGKKSYFTSMATSGPVPASDQYVVIDLGGRQNVKNVVSYWRKLAYPESLTVQVSDDNSSWKTVQNSIDAGKGAFARSEAGDPMVVVSTKAEPCRYIKLLVKKGSPFFTKHEGWNFVQLMEVEAFTE